MNKLDEAFDMAKRMAGLNKIVGDLDFKLGVCAKERDDAAARAEQAEARADAMRDVLRRARPSVEWFSSRGNPEDHAVLAEIDHELEGKK